MIGLWLVFPDCRCCLFLMFTQSPLQSSSCARYRITRLCFSQWVSCPFGVPKNLMTTWSSLADKDCEYGRKLRKNLLLFKATPIKQYSGFYYTGGSFLNFKQAVSSLHLLNLQPPPILRPPPPPPPTLRNALKTSPE